MRDGDLKWEREQAKRGRERMGVGNPLYRFVQYGDVGEKMGPPSHPPTRKRETVHCVCTVSAMRTACACW